MKRVHVEIEGVAPLLFGGFAGPPQRGSKPKTKEEMVEEALRRAYRNGNGLFMPAANLKKCLVESTRMAKLKRGKASLEPYMRAGIFVDPAEIPFGRDEPDGIHECTGRIPPRTGGAVTIRRPILNEWSLAFGILVVDPLMEDDDLHTAVVFAGQYKGLGDWRPEYGRFEVKAFEVAEH